MVHLNFGVEGPRGAPWLVLSNSLGSTSDMWSPQMPELRSRFRVIRYEHRGHGSTPAPPGPYRIGDLGSDLLGILDAAGAERAHVVGLSLGGAVAMWLAATHPERVDRMVLAATKANWSPAGPWLDRADLVRREGTAILADALMQRWFTAPFVTGRPDLSVALNEMLASATPEGYAACCEALAEADLRSLLPWIQAPTLVICGDADPVVSLRDAVELCDSIPGSCMQSLSPASHLLNMEQPDRFACAVVDHLCASAAERGEKTRREVLGDDHVERAKKLDSPLSESFSSFITRYAWGDIWSRPGLDRRTRSFVTIAMLVALGRSDELGLHLVAALRNGLTQEEISEVLLHCAVYAGVPAANTAFAVARRVLGSAGEA